jgi:hypothetical protein
MHKEPVEGDTGRNISVEIADDYRLAVPLDGVETMI